MALHMTTATHANNAAHDPPIGWRRYLFSTNHKDIGTMYFVFAIASGMIGALLSILMRLELQEPGLQIFSGQHAYAVVATAHGLIMIFLL
jgi:cytochrome c oxidase subunit 1